jgi:hypothetical protein
MRGSFLLTWKVPMLIKEAIQEVARKLKNPSNIVIQDNSLINDYPEDLNESDIRMAMMAISAVSDVILQVD